MEKNRLGKVFSALFFGALLCGGVYWTFFAEVEGTVDFLGKTLSLTSLVHAESAMCLIVILGFGWIVYTDAKSK